MPDDFRLAEYVFIMDKKVKTRQQRVHAVTTRSEVQNLRRVFGTEPHPEVEAVQTPIPAEDQTRLPKSFLDYTESRLEDACCTLVQCLDNLSA